MSDNYKNDMSAGDDLMMDTRTRAQLRRTDPWEVRGAYAWVQRVRSSCPEFADVADGALMRVAPLIAEVREASPESLGVALRGVNEARVRRLLATDREGIQDQLSKIVRLLRRKVNVRELVETYVFWGEHRRRQIARDYFGAIPMKESNGE